MSKSIVPQVIFLYGPAGCGKGTQAFELLAKYPEYLYIEVGEILRQYVRDYEQATGVNGDIARRTQSTMHKGLAIDFEDWKHIWNQVVNPLLQEGKNLLIDGAFREYNQSLFLANTISNLQVTCALFVIHITVEEAIKRLSTRYYAYGSRQPYTSYEEAKKNSPTGTEPVARIDDQDPSVIQARYKRQYETQFGRCISLYQRVTGGELYLIDGEQSVQDVFIQIHQNLENFATKATKIPK